MNRKPSVPVKKAVKMMNSEDDNFMKQHLKLRYTEGDVWFYLKAETEKDSEAMLKVIIRINAASYDNSLALVQLSRKFLREKTFTDFAINFFRPSSKVSPCNFRHATPILIFLESFLHKSFRYRVCCFGLRLCCPNLIDPSIKI